jgi:hypothetical protein
VQPTLLAVLALTVRAVAGQTVPQVASPCVTSDDAAYGVTREQPVQVGGGAAYVAARERRYLDVLRGPAGQAVRYRRTGSLEGSDERTILDRYELTYDGLERPLLLYLDAYHFDDALKAPRGLVCAAPIGLNPPGPDVFLAMADLIALAIEQGTTREFAPISIDADGSATHGVILDHFRLVARLARNAALAGHPLDAAAPAGETARARTVLVAFPISCAGRPVSPISVELVGAQGSASRREGESIGGDAAARLVAGVNLPAGAIASSYFVDRPRPGDAVRIVYPDGACGTSSEVTLPLTSTPARPMQTPPPTLPAGQSLPDRPVRLQALLDFDGTARRVMYIGGPLALTPAAVDTVRAWTAEPARINGAPMITPVTFQVKFERR